LNAAVIARPAAGHTAGKNGLENAGFVNMTIPFSAGERRMESQVVRMRGHAT